MEVSHRSNEGPNAGELGDMSQARATSLRVAGQIRTLSSQDLAEFPPEIEKNQEQGGRRKEKERSHLHLEIFVRRRGRESR